MGRYVEYYLNFLVARQLLNSIIFLFIAYKEANEMFAKAILEVASSGDCVWIHGKRTNLASDSKRAPRPRF
jgi:hypothetical protein